MLNRSYIPHIKTQARAANLILFTGAGFSLGAKNILGEAPPLARDLKPLFWKIGYGDEYLDEGFSLSDIYNDCLNKNPKELRDKTLERLTIKYDSLEEWYRPYFELPWLSAYTLNIDNLEEVASNQFQLTRKIIAISATSEFTTKLNLTSSDSLQLIHLNGCLEDLPDRVTFSTMQYAKRATELDPWILRLSNDLLSHSVIFVGTDLNEPPFWSYISLRGSRGGRNLGEMRPRSYLVIPRLSKPRESLLNDFNIVHIPMTAEEFAHNVLSEISKEDITEGYGKLKRHHDADRSALRPLDLKNADLNPTLKTEFLMGQEPTWSDITSGRSIETKFDEKFETVVRKELGKSRPSHILVTGPAGSGKTTSLMRIALKLNAEGKHVYWVDKNTEVGPGKILNFLMSEEEIDVLAIDDSDVYGAQLSVLLSETSKVDSFPLILFEMRSHFIDRCLVSPYLVGMSLIELVVPRLANRDIERLIGVLDKEHRLGHLKGKTLNQQIAAFRDKAERQLVVAMYEATTGLRFREKVVDEMEQLEEPAKSIYALTAVASTRRFSLTKDEIILSVGDTSNKTANEIERLVNRRLLIHSRNDKTLYTCRHRVIGEFVHSAVHKMGMMYPIISGLLRMAALKATSQMSSSSKPNRMLRVFINHDFVYEMLDFNQSQKLYSELEPLLNNSHHFWLHRGSIEVEYGSVGHAENYIAQALNLAATDPLVRNEWAYLLFKKANIVANALDAPKWAEEAENILIELIYEDKSHPHPYHVLGSQGLIWSRVGIREDKERVRYLERLEKHIRKGVEEFPTNTKIQEIRQKMQREYLSLAVK